MQRDRTSLALDLLTRWLDWAERYWRPLDAGRGCWGTGYEHWGVQSHQKYVAAAAVVAALDRADAGRRDRALARARAGLRWTLDTHVSGPGRCSDGTQWGRSWISALGIVRLWHGVTRLAPFLDDADRDALRRVLWSEADWLSADYRRGAEPGIRASKWNHEGHNDPESNHWNGALLWRAAAQWPDAPHADRWREQAHRFLINGASRACDAGDDRIVAGRPVRDRHVGPNFFDHFALDHHGYMNVGYMIVTVSSAAMAHFDLAEAGLPRPESLDHGMDGLWDAARRMVFRDGRLIRIGGDSRVRYAYCQDMLGAALLYAADRLRDPHAPALADAHVELIAREARAAPDDGRLFSERLAEMERELPLYYTRLESDRAVALSMYLAWRPRVAAPAPAPEPAALEVSAGGAWTEPEHGDALHRCPTRFASFAWRGHGWTIGLCLPPDAGDLADWWQNLVSVVRFMGDGAPDGTLGHGARHRRLLHYWVRGIEGGFLTCGAVMEGMNLEGESLKMGDMARHDIAFAALPDGHTVVGLERVTIGPKRAWIVELKGLHLNIANDVYNRFRRDIRSPAGLRTLLGPAARDENIALGGRWANVDGRLGAALLYGAEELVLSRSAQRRGGRYRTLHVEELCAPCRSGAFPAEPGETVLDLGWAALASADADATAAFAARAARETPAFDGDRRSIAVEGLDGRRYTLTADFGDPAPPEPLTLTIA